MNIDAIKPLQDNVLVRLAAHANAKTEEFTPGGILLPKARNAPKGNELVEAEIVAAGPGRWSDTWAGHEKGTNTAGDGFWVPMGKDIKPGAIVLVEGGGQTGDRVWSDEREEYRMVKEDNIAAVIEE